VEGPPAGVSINRRAFYTEIGSGAAGQIWCHFAIPTPLIVSDRRLKINSGLIRFVTSSRDVFLAQLEVWDSEVRVASQRLDLSGDHADPFERIDVRGAPPVNWAIGLSMMVQFNGRGFVRFLTAGADFV
jgi:hypothetical protein